jgi:hypothetical protein
LLAKIAEHLLHAKKEFVDLRAATNNASCFGFSIFISCSNSLRCFDGNLLLLFLHLAIAENAFQIAPEVAY